MKLDYASALTTAGHGYAAWWAATAEVGARALRASAADSEGIATSAARALRAPAAYRGAALEDTLQCAFDAQSQYLHGLRGMSALWGMAFLRNFDAARHK